MGKFFFIIMQGSVSIMTPSSPLLEKRKNSFDNLKLFDKAFVYQKQTDTSKKMDKNNYNNNLAPIENQIEDTMNEIKVLISGETFGEYSLINNQPTQASIKCREECHFAILEKKDFNNILSKIWKKKKNKKKKIGESQKINSVANCEFFGKMPIFKNFSDFQIQHFFINFTEKHCKRNFMVFQEENQADEIFFIREGEFLV